MFKQCNTFTNFLIKQVKAKGQTDVEKLMKKNNLELEKLKVESKDLHEKIEDLRSKNIKLKRMVNNLNYDLVKSTKMQSRTKEKLESKQKFLSLFENEQTEYRSLVSKFNKLLDYNYSPEEEATKGLQMLKEFELIYRNWRTTEKDLLLDIKNQERGVSRNVMGVISAKDVDRLGLKKIALLDKQCMPMVQYVGKKSVCIGTEVLNRDIFTKKELRELKLKKKKFKSNNLLAVEKKSTGGGQIRSNIQTLSNVEFLRKEDGAISPQKLETAKNSVLGGAGNFSHYSRNSSAVSFSHSNFEVDTQEIHSKSKSRLATVKGPSSGNQTPIPPQIDVSITNHVVGRRSLKNKNIQSIQSDSRRRLSMEGSMSQIGAHESSKKASESLQNVQETDQKLPAKRRSTFSKMGQNSQDASPSRFKRNEQAKKTTDINLGQDGVNALSEDNGSNPFIGGLDNMKPKGRTIFLDSATGVGIGVKSPIQSRQRIEEKKQSEEGAFKFTSLQKAEEGQELKESPLVKKKEASVTEIDRVGEDRSKSGIEENGKLLEDQSVDDS